MNQQAVRARIPADDGRIVLDSGGLTALMGRSAKARDLLRWIVGRAGTTVVPAAVLVETVTGHAGRDAETNRVLRVLLGDQDPAAVDAPVARLAGALRYRARADDGIDALVAAEAARTHEPCVLLTSDPGDLSELLADQPQVTVRAV